MLGLKLPTDPRWAKLCETNIEEVLTDHAWCEQKAATNCINLIINNSEKPELVSKMLEIAQEEVEHFKMVHDIILKRGYTFGRERRDDYVNELVKFMRKGASREQALIDRLLFAALIEARSCERFKVLSETIDDEELSKFYYDLMVSEANHYTVFLKFAKKYTETVDVDKRWKEWLAYEAEIIQSYGKEETIHG